MVIPRLIVGCERLGSVLPDRLVSQRDRDAVLRYLDGVREAGFTAFDLAASYQVGGTERVMGHWLRSRGRRDELYLIGKGGHPLPVLKPNRLSPADVLSDLHASLERLGCRYFDLYLLHRDHPQADMPALARALDRAVKTGLVRALGASNWTHDRIAAFNALAVREDLTPLRASRPQFSLAVWVRPQFDGCVSVAGKSEALAFYERERLPVLAWSPLGRGFFAGRPNAVYDTPANHARRARVLDLASRLGVPPTTVALAYVLHQPFPSSAIVASREVDKMRSNWDAADLGLTRAECRWLETGETREQSSAQSP